MHAWPLLLVVILCSGCGYRLPRDPQTPAASITVFNDGFHSGFILPYADLPFTLSTEAAAPPPFVEIGFSEWAWAINADRSRAHACRLLVWPSPGVLMVSYLADERRNADALIPRIAYAIPIDAEQKAAFDAEIVAWINPAKPALYTTDGPRPLHFLASTRDYTLLGNCHDFTAHMLRVLGLPIPWTMARTPDRFTGEIRQAVAGARERGWPIVNMTPHIVYSEASP